MAITRRISLVKTSARLLVPVLALLARVAFAQTNITTSANGIGIPAPTDTTTYDVTDGVNTVHVPSGMVYVPAGTFTYGTGATAASVALDGFCISRFHVTNAEYKAFLNATGSTNYPSYWSGGTYPAGKANHPVNFVSLTSANAYAAWVSAQTGWNAVVPSAPQWEKAARGPSAFTYPWGNTLDATYTGGVLTAKANFNANVTSFYLTNHGSDPAIYNNASSTHYNQTVTVGTIAAYATGTDAATPLAVTPSASVSGYVDHTTFTGFIYTDVFAAINAAGGYTTPEGSYPNGVSPYGAYDMGGNLWHWTTTTFIATNGAEAGQTVNMVRGGSWYSTGASCKSYDIGEGRSATGVFNSVGFRVAMIPLAITTAATLPYGTVNTAYSQTLAATNGTAPYTWSVSSGALPAGITLSSAGVLSGTPTAGGVFAFTVQVTTAAGGTLAKTFTLTVASDALDHFTWDYVPAGLNAGSPFAVHLTARDVLGNVITGYNGTASITAQSGSGSSASLSPIVVTEVAPGNEKQFEIQNVSSATVNTSGWFVRINDTTNTTSPAVSDMNSMNATVFNLPASMAAGQIIRVTASSTNTTGGRTYFGSAIAWSNVPGKRYGWVAVFDGSSALRDIFMWGWTAAYTAQFGITVNGNAITLASQWSGAGTTSGSGAAGSTTVDSFQRAGASDNNTTADWTWKHNSDSSDATSLGTTNTGLTIPFASTGAVPVGITSSATFVNGEFLGYLTFVAAGSNVIITTNDGASHTGASTALTVGAAPVSTAGDGIPDSWKIANGFSVSANIASLDSDGDGMTNLQEYLAGTDPKSAASALAIASSGVPAAQQFRVTWASVAGKLYRVRTSSDLTNWTTLTTVLPATDGAQTVTMDTGGTTQLFVRVEIVPAQ
jgi:formylglycine-generating enzyme required for sulfatase activity